MVDIGSEYRHFKGNLYIVLDIINNNVIYENVKKELWIRPLDMFDDIHPSGVKRFVETGYGIIPNESGTRFATHGENGYEYVVDFDNKRIGVIIY